MAPTFAFVMGVDAFRKVDPARVHAALVHFGWRPEERHDRSHAFVFLSAGRVIDAVNLPLKQSAVNYPSAIEAIVERIADHSGADPMGVASLLLGEIRD